MQVPTAHPPSPCFGVASRAAGTALICHGEMENGKQLPRICPNACEAEAGRNSEAGESFLCVFIGKLRDDSFAARKKKFLAADMDCLFRFADQVHLNATRALVVNRLVSPEREIEVRAELTVRANEKIQIEFGGYAGAVVIGGFQNGAIFLKIDADDQPSAPPAEPANAPEKIRSDFRLHISNGRAGK